jgi:hypothetical protein
MTEQEAYDFAFRCWQLGFAKKVIMTGLDIIAFGKYAELKKEIQRNTWNLHRMSTLCRLLKRCSDGPL